MVFLPHPSSCGIHPSLLEYSSWFVYSQCVVQSVLLILWCSFVQFCYSHFCISVHFVLLTFAFCFILFLCSCCWFLWILCCSLCDVHPDIHLFILSCLPWHLQSFCGTHRGFSDSFYFCIHSVVHLSILASISVVHPVMVICSSSYNSSLHLCPSFTSQFYNGMQLTDTQKEERMTACSRHRGRYTPPSTPEHYWSVDFPDTPTCLQRGKQPDKVRIAPLVIVRCQWHAASRSWHSHWLACTELSYL